MRLFLAGNRDCAIDRARRNWCPYCRLQKCFTVGMNSECKYSIFDVQMYSVSTLRLHVMQRTVCLRYSVRLSVRPSVRCVYCDKTKWCTANILIPHETAITLVFWHQQWLVDDALFPLKSVQKLTHPFEKRRLWRISDYNVSTVRDSEKIQVWRI